MARFPILPLIAGSVGGMAGRLPLALRISARADVVRLPFFGKKIFFLTHPNDLRHVLQTRASNYRKSFDYRFLAELMGEGLVTSEGELWRSDRRMLQPSFHQQALKEFTATIGRETASVLARWRGLPPGTRIDVFCEMMRLTVTVIGQRLFSADVSKDAERIRELISQTLWFLVRRSQALVDLAKYFRTPGRRRFEAARAELTGILEAYLEPRWRAPPDPRCADIVEVLKTAGVSRQAAIEHLITLFAAGHETTAGVLGWALHALAQNPQVQQQLWLSLGDDTSREAALEGVIQETMRCYPPLPVIGREALAEDRLGQVLIPKGATIVIFIYGTHHRADLWDNPSHFDPTRFSAAARKQIIPGAHLPFGLGPRSCVGASFAMLEMKMALAAIVGAFRIVADIDGPTPKLIPMVSLRADRPVFVRLEPRGPHP